MAHGYGPFKVLEWIGDNVYELEPLGGMNMNATFTMGDLALYMKDDFENLRVDPSQEGNFDAIQTLNQLWATPLSSPNSKLSSSHQEHHHSSTTLEFGLDFHLPNKVHLGYSVLLWEARESTLSW